MSSLLDTFANSSIGIIAMLLAGGCFVFYLFYTRQFKWLFGVIKNAALGMVGLLLGNWLFASMGLTVGVNLLTVFIAGLLGLPGLLMLFVTGWMI